MPSDERLVVDSSVFAAVLLREPGHDLLAERLAAAARLHTAPFFRFEVANAIWKQRHWPADAASAALELLFALPVDDHFTVEDAHLAMELARSRRHPFYDTAFVALAIHLELPLWTLDQRQASLAAEAGAALA